MAEVNRQEAAYQNWSQSAEYVHALHVADAWCAAFMWRKTPDAPLAMTEEVFQALHDPTADAAPQSTHNEVIRLGDQYRFFHWHLEFPEVFSVPESGTGVDELTGWTGGFDCMLGNPPWERIKLKEQEFFAQRDTDIATASSTAVRRALITALPETRPELANEFSEVKRQGDGEAHFIRNSGKYPLTGIGTVNTYAAFAEGNHRLVSPLGRMGVIVPTGIATDITTQHFFKNLVKNRTISSLYDFENATPLFPGVHRSFKFSILSISGKSECQSAARFAFFLHDPAELDDAEKSFTLTSEEFQLLNPNTGTCPVFRTRRDADICLAVHRRAPVLIRTGDPRGNPWGVSLGRMYHMSEDSYLFHERKSLESEGWILSGNSFEKDEARMLPLYEGRMGHQYSHRFADSTGSRETSQLELEDANFVVQPQYWVSSEETRKRQERRSFGCTSGMLGHRRVARNNDERTSIAAIIPWGAASYGWTLSAGPSADKLALLVATYNSFPYDYVLRNSFSQPSIPQSTSEQVPIPPPAILNRHHIFIVPRVIELTYTAYDMAPFAHDLGCTGGPYHWNEARRQAIRAELDALFFHLYGISREDVDYILDTFPIVRRKDETKYGSYRTKELILAEYDRMAAAGVSLENPLIDGESYTSTLTPPRATAPGMRRSPRPTEVAPLRGWGPKRGSAACGVADEARPAVAGDGQVGAGHVLGVTYVDGVFCDGDLHAVVSLRAAVAGLEPGEFRGPHSSPRSLSSRPRDSLGLRACERSVS